MIVDTSGIEPASRGGMFDRIRQDSWLIPNHHERTVGFFSLVFSIAA